MNGVFRSHFHRCSKERHHPRINPRSFPKTTGCISVFPAKSCFPRALLKQASTFVAADRLLGKQQHQQQQWQLLLSLQREQQ